MILTPEQRARENERLRKAKNESRARDRDISIRLCEDPDRRAERLADPVKFLKGYFPQRYTRPFSDDQLEAIDLIVKSAKYGQDQIICAPRGDWKTETCKGLIVYLIAAQIIKFPVIIGSTATDAFKKYDDIKGHFESELFGNDFPEIADPIAALERTPTKANKMTYKGEYLNFVWSKEYCTFPQVPDVPGVGGPSPYGQCAIEYRGLDASIRGINIRGRRPDLAFGDDLETEESANSDKQIEDRRDRWDNAVGGLAGGGETLCRIALGTVQNEKCLTNQLLKDWGGKRYKAVMKWPGGVDTLAEADMKLCEEYIDLYREEKEAGIKLMPKSHAFYKENQKAIEDGVVMSNPHYKSRKKRPDGEDLELTAFQSVLNKWANRKANGRKYVLTEIQNDPPPDEQVETMGLTHKIVMSRINEFKQGEVKKDHECVTVGIDLGQYECHWVAGNFVQGFTGLIHNYGVIDVNTTQKETKENQERAMYRALMSFRNEMMEWDFEPKIVCVDSGNFTKVAYEFVRDANGPFYATKGWDHDNFSVGNPSKSRVVIDETAFGTLQVKEALWLYNFKAGYWKRFVHQRFLEETLDEAGQFNPGALSLFNPGRKKDGSYDTRRHISFAKHIVAEEYRREFIEGKGFKNGWHQLTKANHWLDATALMCLAAKMGGIDLKFDRPEVIAAQPQKKQPALTGPGGVPYLVTQR